MSVGYTWVQWSRHKRIYDGLIACAALTYVGVYFGATKLLWSGENSYSDEIVLIRATGSCAVILLHVILCIGPLARLDRRVLPLLYNRRHLGVMTFLVALLHAIVVLGYYHGFGVDNPFLSLLTNNANYVSLSVFPFTKRAERIAELDRELAWRPQIWMGVSVESEKYTFRIDHLSETHAHVKFLSLEPLIGPLPRLNLQGIDWVIVGGESGPGARPMDPAWVTEIRDQCLDAGVAFFFKQWGGVVKSRTGRGLEGRTWDEMPRNLNERSVLFSLPQLAG